MTDQYTVVTSFSPEGYEKYGYHFVKMFDKFWPKNMNLIIFTENDDHLPVILDVDNSRISVHNLLKESPSCYEFLERHKDNKIINGTEMKSGHVWASKNIKEGYNFRYDAYKFCRKPFAIEAALNHVEEGFLFWVDADVITFRQIPISFFSEVLPQDKVLSFLGRGKNISECGFMGFNLKQFKGHSKNIIRTITSLYATDDFLNEGEWNDCFIFDAVRKVALEPEDWFDIPSTRNSSPFNTSMLANYMDHLKGNRKDSLVDIYKIKRDSIKTGKMSPV